MDPWLSGNGAFLHTWFPYPDNTGIADQVIRQLGGRQLYVYISHVHEDHCDLDFLRRLEPFGPTYLLPNFLDDSLRRRLQPVAAEKRILQDGEQAELGRDFTVRLFLEESGLNTDSAILAQCNGHTFFNLNDCKLYDRLATLEMPAIEILTCQFSGATWHPVCYEYDEATYRGISLKRKNAKFFQVEKALRSIEPAVFIPSAGPAVFLHPKLYHHNFEPVNIFPKAEEFAAHLVRRSLKSEVRILRPGQGLVPGSSTVQDVMRNDGMQALDSYRRSKQHLFAAGDHGDPDLLVEPLLREVRTKLRHFRQN